MDAEGVSVVEEGQQVALTIRVPQDALGAGGESERLLKAVSALMASRSIILLDPWTVPRDNLRRLIGRLCLQSGERVLRSGRGSQALLALTENEGEVRIAYVLAPRGTMGFDAAQAVTSALGAVAYANLVPSGLVTVAIAEEGSGITANRIWTARDLRWYLLEHEIDAGDLLDPWLRGLRERDARERQREESLEARRQEVERLEAELLTERARIQRVARTAERSALSGDIGHKVKTSLAIISNDTKMLSFVLAEAPSREDREDFEAAQSRIVEAASRIMALIEELGDPDRPFGVRPVRTTGAVLAHLTELVAARFSGQVPVTVAPIAQEAAATALDIDLAKFEDIIEELISNGTHFPVEGRPLAVGVEFAVDRETSRWVMQVHDNGRGLARDGKYLVFDPGVTTRKNGTGKGLAFCRRYVEALGGEITEEGVFGTGATFVVRFPLIEGRNA